MKTPGIHFQGTLCCLGWEIPMRARFNIEVALPGSVNLLVLRDSGEVNIVKGFRLAQGCTPGF